jgi:flagellar biosynthesis chaperone FliJ
MLHFFVLKETTKKMEIAACMQKIQYLESRKERLNGNIRELLDRVPQDADLQLVPYQGPKISLDLKELKITELEIKKQTEELDMRRAELVNIVRRKKALEALKDKKAQEFRVEQSRREQKLLDQTYQLTSKFRG